MESEETLKEYADFSVSEEDMRIYLKKWKKNIISKIMPIIIIIPFCVMILLAVITATDIIEKLIFLMYFGIMLYILLNTIIKGIYNIYGYIASQKGAWKETTVLVQTNTWGKIRGQYWKNGQLHTEKIKYQYGDEPRYFQVQNYATLIHFESMDKYMLVTDTRWMERSEEKEQKQEKQRQEEDKQYSNVIVSREEREKYLQGWKKQINIDTMKILVSMVVMLVLIMLITSVTDSSVVRLLCMVAMVIGVIYFMAKSYMQILGYTKSQNGIWKKTLVYIVDKKNGILNVRYEKNGKLYEDSLAYQYGEKRRNIQKRTYATLIYFESMDKYMLVKDVQWAKKMEK